MLGLSAMQTQDIDYRCEAANLRGVLVFDETVAGPRPGVLVVHEADWGSAIS